ncbi:MAG: hypothetical protein ACTHMC_10865 [Pseudobacter sp.]|uniref:hypothetical protein n=1 Tax=Pseudobacter sp. TaxID=2045420 RepID=UPI003F7F8839
MLNKLAVLLVMVAAISSCKKNKDDYGNPAILQAFNLMDDGIEIRTNLSGAHPIRYSSAKRLLNKDIFYENTILVNQFPQPIALYAIPDTLEKDRPVVDMVLECKPGDMYSLFLYGTKADAGYILNKEDHRAGDPKDSLAFFRIVNLCPDQRISVNLKDEPQGSFAEDVAFRQLTSFSGIRADKSVSRLEFEIRDQVSGDLITTYTAININDYQGKNFWLNKTSTLIFTGRKNGTGLNAPKIVLAPHSM